MYLDNSTGPIWEYSVSSFEDLRDLLENHLINVEEHVFRGQADKNWHLTTTLDRLILRAQKSGVKKGSIEKFVREHLERFRLEIRGRRGDNPSKLEEDELWALGQHYGLATPLLDWSQSPYISIFFALVEIMDSESERVLWCLNQSKVEKINNGLSEDHKLRLLFPDSNDNKRLLGQSGLFSKGPVMMHLDDWVQQNAMPKDYPLLLKIAFPGNHWFRKSALKKLKLMNITHSTIFPDLSGASSYCNVVAEDYEEG